MKLFEKIMSIYPDLTELDFLPAIGTILIQDDSDGKGPYIAEWENDHSQPTASQLE
jgi:hypothetical protein